MEDAKRVMLGSFRPEGAKKLRSLADGFIPKCYPGGSGLSAPGGTAGGSTFSGG